MLKAKLGLVCVCMAVIICAGCSHRAEIVGHRGASYLAPENTVASANKAWELDSDAVEIDIYKTTDDKIIVFHDKNTKRITGANHKVSQTDFKTLRSLEVGSFKGEQYRGEKMPTLQEIIDTMPKGKNLYIEVKSGTEILPILEEELRNNKDKMSQFRMICFNYDVVTQFKKDMPQIPTYWLRITKKDKNKKYLPLDDSVIQKALDANLDGVDVHYAGVTEEFVKNAHANGLGVYTWTVNSVEEAQRLATLKIDGITTDRPGFLASELGYK